MVLWVRWGKATTLICQWRPVSCHSWSNGTPWWMRLLNTDLSYLGNALQKGVKVDGDLDNSEKILLPQLVSSGLTEGQQPLTTLPAVTVKKHIQKMSIDILGSPLERSLRDMLLVDVSLVQVKVSINLERTPAAIPKVYSVDRHRLLLKHIIVGCNRTNSVYTWFSWQLFRDMLLVDVSLVQVKVSLDLERTPASIPKVYSVDGQKLLVTKTYHCWMQ